MVVMSEHNHRFDACNIDTRNLMHRFKQTVAATHTRLLSNYMIFFYVRSKNIKTLKLEHQDVKAIRTVRRCKKHPEKRITPFVPTMVDLPTYTLEFFSE